MTIFILQMYKVFFKESSFLLTDDASFLQNSSNVYVYSSEEKLADYVFSLLKETEEFEVILYHADFRVLKSSFDSLFVRVKAAGGAVIQGNFLLMIKRWGMYDLPKGHVEKCETVEECALREVEEECGVKGLYIVSSLENTWHIYEREGNWHLKTTDWFVMGCSADVTLIPQTEEDIEEVFWLPVCRIQEILPYTYPSLRKILIQIS